MSDALYKLKWGAERSMRYHERRIVFYKRLDNLVNTLGLISGSGAVGALLVNSAGGTNPLLNLIAIFFGSIVALFSFIALTARPAHMTSVHSHLKQRFAALRSDMIGVTDADTGRIEDLERSRHDIEREEPPIMRIVDLQCHNELCLAWGKARPDCMYHVPAFKALTADYFNWDSSSIVTEEVHQATSRPATPVQK